MIYHQRDNKRRKKKILVTTGMIGGVLVVALILNLIQPNFFSPMIHLIGRPFLEARGGFFGNVASAFDSLKSKDDLIKENQDLKNKLALFDAIQTERDFYKYENAQILKLAGKPDSAAKYIAARILSKPGFSPYDTIILDVGTKEGVKVGQKVLADQDVILGLVSEAYAHTSVVMLYSSPEREIQVFVGQKSLQALATGKGGGNFDIKLPRNAEIKVNDIVVMASSSPKILGAIQYITTTPTDTFERAMFKSSVDIGAISYVIIEK